ncbi:MAG: FISUMP domain-containing protein, partial [Bacteroidota bacterium]
FVTVGQANMTDITVEGVALGPGKDDIQTETLYKENVFRAITESLNSGHDIQEIFEYELKEDCVTICPPFSECKTIYTVKPEDVAYEATIQLVRLDDGGKMIPNSEYEINTLLNVHETKLADCRVVDPVPMEIPKTTLSGQVFTIKTEQPNGAYTTLGIAYDDRGVRGAKVRVWEPSSQEVLSWEFTQIEEDIYTIKAVIPNTDYIVLDGSLGEGNIDGSFVHLWSPTGGDNQKWRVTPNEDGTYLMQSLDARISERFVDLQLGGNYAKKGGTVHMWHKTGGTNQNWTLIPVDAAPATANTDTDTNTNTAANIGPTVTLGHLEWMTQNLRTETCQDGSPIPSDYFVYGGEDVLYNYQALETCDVCPSGWRLPADYDFSRLQEADVTMDVILYGINLEGALPSDYLRVEDGRFSLEHIEVILDGSSLDYDKGEESDYDVVRCVREIN